MKYCGTTRRERAHDLRTKNRARKPNSTLFLDFEQFRVSQFYENYFSADWRYQGGVESR